jgi:hypothetical protein
LFLEWKVAENKYDVAPLKTNFATIELSDGFCEVADRVIVIEQTQYHDRRVVAPDLGRLFEVRAFSASPKRVPRS